MYRSCSNLTAISSSSCESGAEDLVEHLYSSPQQGDVCGQPSVQPALAHPKEECLTPTDSQGASDHEGPSGHMHLTNPHKLSSPARGARPLAPGFTCRICSRTFSRKSHLKQHQQRHVTELSRPLCSICGKDYGRRADLARHVRSKHEENRFWCRYCGNIYNRSDILR
ncbi:DNA-binding transcription factor adr1, partial [Lithohypha guttulata]